MTLVLRPFSLLVIRHFLVQENCRRTEEDGGQRFFDENGEELDPTLLDVTDRVNQAFIYPLSSEVRSC